MIAAARHHLLLNRSHAYSEKVVEAIKPVQDKSNSAIRQNYDRKLDCLPGLLAEVKLQEQGDRSPHTGPQERADAVPTHHTFGLGVGTGGMIRTLSDAGEKSNG